MLVDGDRHHQTPDSKRLLIALAVELILSLRGFSMSNSSSVFWTWTRSPLSAADNPHDRPKRPPVQLDALS